MGRIAVIGGGPAGLFAALEAADRGHHVSLYEKHRIGEIIKCAEGYFDTLKILEKPEEGVLFKVQNIVVQMENQYRINCENFQLWMIDRAQWQRHLGEKARERGVDIFEKTKIGNKELKELQGENDWVIDASGTSCITSKLYGFREFYKENSIAVLQYVLDGDFSYIGENIKVGLEPHCIGYYWIFPRGKNREGQETANVGIGFFQGNEGLNLRTELNRVLKKERLEDYKILKKTGGRIPVKVLEPLVYDNIMLAGDAAGLVSPLHAGGIDLACISGKVAVQEAEKGGEDYYKRLWKIVGPKLQMEQDLLEFWKKLEYTAFEEIFGIALAEDKKITPALLWKYRGLLGREMNTLKTFLAGVIKMDWQGRCREGKIPFPFVE